MSPERTEQQAAAVERRDRDVFLRAGAGTGKTSVLVDRFCAAALDPAVASSASSPSPSPNGQRISCDAGSGTSSRRESTRQRVSASRP